MVRTGNGGGCNGPRFSEEFALCVYISFRTLRKNTFVIYFHYADTYLCASLPTCHVLSYDFTSFSPHQGWREPPQERFFAKAKRYKMKRKEGKLKEENMSKKSCWNKRYIYSLLNIINQGSDEIKNRRILILTYIYMHIYMYIHICKYTYYIILSVSRGWNNWVWREKKKKICIFFSHLVAYICIQLEYIKRLRE